MLHLKVVVEGGFVVVGVVVVNVPVVLRILVL
jgi:hypothetical protein